MARRALRRIGIVVGLLLATLAITLAGGLWWANTDGGVRFALAQAGALVERGGGRLEIDGERGGLLGSLRIDRLAWTSAGGLRVVADDIAFDWAPRRLLGATVAVSHIGARTVRVELAPGDEAASAPARAPLPMPETFALPLALVVDDVDVGVLQIVPAGKPADPIELRDLHARARLDAERWRVDALRLQSAYGDLLDGRLAVDPAAPHAIEATLPLAGRLDAQQWRGELGAGGDLARLDVSLSARQLPPGDAPTGASVDLDAVLAPLAPMPLVSARGRIDALDLRAWMPALPTTDLSARFDARAAARNDPDGTTLAGRLEATNAKAGAVADQRLPVSRVDTRFDALIAGDGTDTRVALEGLGVRLAGGGTIDGRLAVSPSHTLTVAGATLPQLQATLRFDAIDSSVFAPALPPTALAGSLDLDRESFTLSLTQDAATTARLMPERLAGNAAAVSIDARGRIDGDTLRLSNARASLGEGTVRMSGSAALVAPWTVTLEGSAERIEPARWLSPDLAADPRLADASLSGRWAVDGVVAPEPDARLSLAVADSRLAGQALTADVTARIVGTTRIEAVDATLALGANRVTVDGALGRPDDRLRIDARIAAPAAIDPRLGGRLDVGATLQGRFDRLRARVEARGERLALRGASADGAGTVASIRLDADLPLSLALAADTPVSVSIAADDVRAAGQHVPGAKLGVQGTLGAHRFDLSVTRDAGAKPAAGSAAARSRSRAKPQQQTLTIAGNASATTGEAPSWQANLQRASLDGPVPASLRSPATLRIDPASIRLAGVELEIAGGAIDLASLRYPLDGSGRIATQGAIRSLPLARLAALAGADASTAGRDALDALRDLRLAGEWSLQGNDLASIEGSASLSLRERAPEGATPRIGLDADDALRLQLADGRLDGAIDLALPSLAFVGALAGPDIAVDGRLQLKGSIGGTVKAPDLSLRLQGSDLDLLQRAIGWRLRKGILDLRLDGRTARLETLAFDSGDGRVELSGDARLREQPRPSPATAPEAGGQARASVVPLDARFELRASRMLVPIGPGQRLVVSGNALLGSGSDGLSLSGGFTVDRGLIELGGSNAPRLPDDVTLVGADGVVTGADGRPTADVEASAKGDDSNAGGGIGGGPDGVDPKRPAPSSALRIASDVSVALGDDLKVNGVGFLARLTGKLQVGGMLPSDPRVVGEIRIRDGSYLAYGQNLQITQGIVRFAGDSTNPALDIEAKRPFLPVEVGVTITGTAKNPTIALTSKPDMPSSDQLSWLVLGVGPDQAPSAAQSLALQQAGKQLLGGESGKRKPGIAERLGFDVFNFGYASNTGVAPGVSESNAPTGLPGSGSGASGSGEGAQREVVTVGKRLSDRLFISYEQGIRGLWNLLRIQYMLTSRIALRGQSGSDTAIDLLYSLTFD